MSFRKQLFAAAGACSLAISTIHLMAQRPRYDGAVPGNSRTWPNQAERARLGREIERPERRLLYVLCLAARWRAVSSEMNGQGIIVSMSHATSNL